MVRRPHRYTSLDLRQSNTNNAWNISCTEKTVVCRLPEIYCNSRKVASSQSKSRNLTKCSLQHWRGLIWWFPSYSILHHLFSPSTELFIFIASNLTTLIKGSLLCYFYKPEKWLIKRSQSKSTDIVSFVSQSLWKPAKSTFAIYLSFTSQPCCSLFNIF